MDIHKKQGGMPIVNETRLTIDTRDSWVVTVQFVAPALREYDIVDNEKKTSQAYWLLFYERPF